MLLQRFMLIIVTTLSVTSSEKSFYTVSPDKGPFTNQIIDIVENTGNSFITILVLSGNYTTTNGSFNNFIAFQNINILRHPNSSDPVNIMCPEFITVSHNGIGFENCINVFISGLNFMNCGVTTSGLYFYNTTNLTITDSVFHHNLENGIQIISGNNIKIMNCNFYRNIGLQSDNSSRLITWSNVNATGGVGLGLLIVNQSDLSLSVINCTFMDNLSYKTIDFSNDTRPFAFIPSGSGGGLDIQIDKVANLYAEVVGCYFYKNTAIHQGGGIVIIVIDSVNSTVSVSGSKFVGNRALGHLLRTLNETIEDYNIDDFIDSINLNFLNITKFLPDIPESFPELGNSGGSGGAISMSLYENAAYNELRVANSYFSQNFAIITGAVGFYVRDSLASVEGAFLNRAVISK